VKDLNSNCKALIFIFLVAASVIPASATLKVGQLEVTPASVNFGTVPVGSTQTQTVTFTDTGLGKLGIWQVAISGTGFQMSGTTFPVILQSNQSLSFQVSFTPQASGTVDGALSITSITSESPTGGRTYAYVTVALSGSGGGGSSGQLNISPTSLNFGTVNDGSSSSLPATLTASGASVTVYSATISNSQFSISGITLPMTIAAGQSVTFDAVFVPINVGSDSATITFSSTATGTPTLSLNGVGASTTYTVSLAWDPSTSPVVGYNVYRGTISGGPYTRINSATDPSTVYSDATVQDGLTYYYVTTAVAGDGSESTYSNQTLAVIP